MALHWQMAIALILGAICGFAFCEYYSVWSTVINGIRNIFINAINMIVVPLVFISTVLSISSIGNSKSMGRVAIKSFLYFVITSILAAFIGVIVTDLLRPGYDAKAMEIDASDILDSANGYESLTMMDKIVSIVPDNIFKAFTSGNILPIIFFALLFGYFVTKINANRQNTINNIFESFNEDRKSVV